MEKIMFKKHKKDKNKLQPIYGTAYIIPDAKEAMDKLSEVSGGKNFQYDIKPFEAMDPRKKCNYLIIKENNIWYLRICQ